MIADVGLPNETHAIGRIMPAPITPAHQLGRVAGFSVIRSTLPIQADPRLPRATEIQWARSDESPIFAWQHECMTSAVSLIRANKLSDIAEYAYAATAPKDARFIFLAGSCPLDADGATIGVGDFAGQAAACVATMQQALAAAGATIHDVISTRVLVASTQQADLVTAWETVRDAFGDHDVPSTLLGVTVLGYDDQLVEIEAIAAVVD